MRSAIIRDVQYELKLEWKCYFTQSKGSGPEGERCSPGFRYADNSCLETKEVGLAEVSMQESEESPGKDLISEEGTQATAKRNP